MDKSYNFTALWELDDGLNSHWKKLRRLDHSEEYYDGLVTDYDASTQDLQELAEQRIQQNTKSWSIERLVLYCAKTTGAISNLNDLFQEKTRKAGTPAQLTDGVTYFESKLFVSAEAKLTSCAVSCLYLLHRADEVLPFLSLVSRTTWNFYDGFHINFETDAQYNEVGYISGHYDLMSALFVDGWAQNQAYELTQSIKQQKSTALVDDYFPRLNSNRETLIAQSLEEIAADRTEDFDYDFLPFFANNYLTMIFNNVHGKKNRELIKKYLPWLFYGVWKSSDLIDHDNAYVYCLGMKWEEITEQDYWVFEGGDIPLLNTLAAQIYFLGIKSFMKMVTSGSVNWHAASSNKYGEFTIAPVMKHFLLALGQHIDDSRKRSLVEKHLQKGINEIMVALTASKTRDALSQYVETILCIFKFTGQLGLADKLIEFFKKESIHDLEFLD